MKQAIKQRWLATRDLLQRYRDVFLHAWKERHNLQGKKLLPVEAEFLPAALSLQETPPSPAPRIAMWLLIALVVLALIWATFGKIDIVATAQGKVVPSGRTKIIQPLETAVVKKIHIADGQSVKAGQILVELDTTSAMADVERVTVDKVSAQLQAARAQALLQAVRTGKLTHLKTPSGISEERVDEAQRLLEGIYAEYTTKLAGFDAEIVKREAELRSIQELINKLQQTAQIARQRADDYQKLVDAKYISQHGFLDREQARIEQEADLATQHSRKQEVKASLLEAESQKKALVAETSRTALDALSDAQQKIATLEQEQIKAKSRAQSLQLASPVDGVVQQLAVHTVGGVVTPAQTLMMIVPQENTLEVEAFLENKDIGFVNAGQDAAVKIETFDYTKYGTLPAKVLHVSTDAITDEKRGLIYSMRVKIARSSIQMKEKTVNLAPGMAVAVEIKTGKRRVIEYFLSPLLQYAHEGLQER